MADPRRAWPCQRGNTRAAAMRRMSPFDDHRCRRGASGCLFTSSEPSLQVRGVTSVHRGEAWFGRTALLDAIRSQIAAQPTIPSELLDDHELLTAREREILGLIGNALSNKEIARRLQISDKTVKTHLHHIYVKLHQSGRYRAFLSSSGLRLN